MGLLVATATGSSLSRLVVVGRPRLDAKLAAAAAAVGAVVPAGVASMTACTSVVKGVI